MGQRVHRAWWVLGCAFLTLTVSNGLTLSALSVFDEHLIATFGWSRGELKLRTLITFAVAGLCAPAAGALIDRFGVRPLLVAGSLALSAALAAYGDIGAAWHAYLLHALLGLSLATAGVIVNVILVSRWFATRRGMAIGIALVGTSLGNAVFPLVNTSLLALLPWRGVFVWLALVPLLLLPLHVLVVREWPAELGLDPLGAGAEQPASGATASGASGGGASYREALRSWYFWGLAITAMITFYGILGAADHLVLHARSLGFSRAQAGQVLSQLFLLGLVGKGLLGFLADRFEPRRVLVGGVAAMALGCLCLATLQRSLLWPFLLLFGLGWGGLYTMIQVLAVQRFGLRASGRILGTITVLDALGGGLGPWVTGLLHDRSGDYQLSFTLMFVLLCLALLLSTTLRPQPAVASAR